MTSHIDSQGNVQDDNGRSVSLRDYIERVIHDYERAHAGLHVELQRAIQQAAGEQVERTKVALESLNKRMDGMNEFRKSLEDVTRNAVSRDLFDIVTNRVTIIENTYVQKQEYDKDSAALRSRHLEDFESRDRRIAELEKNTVKTDALKTQSDEVARTRKALVAAIAVGAFLTVANFLVNAIQLAVHHP